jgi:glycosyltransferase involved in cell wall biosynthesis
LNLLLLCEYATLNGGEQSMLATLDAVRQAGFSLAAMAPASGPLADAFRARQIEVIPFTTRDSAGMALPRAEVREALAAALRQRRASLLHANSLAMGRLSGPVAAALGLPSIAHLRDIGRLSRQAIDDLNCHTRLLAVSQATREYHVAAGLSGEKTHVLYNGVDLARFAPRPSPGELHRELRLPPETVLVGVIGQIGLRKGHDVLVQAAVRLTQRLPHVHYLIVGSRYSDKAESRRFENQLHAAAAGPLKGRFHFLGVRGHVERILNELALLVHPARQEPLGRVLLEAAASAVAVVASDVGGTREIFPPQSHSARLVPPDDPIALSRAMLEVLCDAPLRAALASSARRRAEEAFDIRSAAAGLIEHYRAVSRQPALERKAER